MGASQASDCRPTNIGVRATLLVGGLFVFAAGIPLFVGTERTDVYFAWTVRPPLTAAFLGASYWASFLLGVLCSRQPCWHRARLAVPGPLLFTLLTLLATLIHIDRFHFGSVQLVARLVTWAWLFIYAAVPLALGISLVLQLRMAGQDPSRQSPLGAGMRSFLIFLVVPTGILGLGLYAAPAATLKLWPWTLTPLTARAVGAWLLAIAVISAQTALEDDVLSTRPAFITMTALGVLQIAALLRYPSDFRWMSVAGWVYLLILIGMLYAGAYSLLFPRSQSLRESV